jgi:hypothetical protein
MTAGQNDRAYMETLSLRDRQAGGPARSRPQPIASCWLCGTQRATSLMIADGGPSCPDVRWYCADTQQCTWRWTGQLSSAAGAQLARPQAARASARPVGPGLADGGGQDRAQAGQAQDDPGDVVVDDAALEAVQRPDQPRARLDTSA